MSVVKLVQPAAPALEQEIRAFTGRHTGKAFDWDAFPGSRGFPELERAQMRYIGGGGSPKTDDPKTLKADHFTLSLVNQPVGKYAPSHSHEVVEHFLVLQGVLTVGWVYGDKVIEAKLGPKDVVLNKSGRPHGFRNDGIEPVLMSITVGSGTPQPPVYVCHPKNKDADLARRFGAGEGPGKVVEFDPTSSDPHQKDMAPYVMRYADRTPVWEKAGFARLAYIGEGGAPPQRYRMEMIHLPRGVGIQAYTRAVEDVYFVIEGNVTVGWEEDGEKVEQRLGTKDMQFNPAGRRHYFRNDGVTDAQFMMLVGTPDPETVEFKAA